MLGLFRCVAQESLRLGVGSVLGGVLLVRQRHLHGGGLGLALVCTAVVTVVVVVVRAVAEFGVEILARTEYALFVLAARQEVRLDGETGRAVAGEDNGAARLALPAGSLVGAVRCPVKEGEPAHAAQVSPAGLSTGGVDAGTCVDACADACVPQ